MVDRCRLERPGASSRGTVERAAPQGRSAGRGSERLERKGPTAEVPGRSVEHLPGPARGRSSRSEGGRWRRPRRPRRHVRRVFGDADDGGDVVRADDATASRAVDGRGAVLGGARVVLNVGGRRRVRRRGRRREEAARVSGDPRRPRRVSRRPWRRLGRRFGSSCAVGVLLQVEASWTDNP